MITTPQYLVSSYQGEQQKGVALLTILLLVVAITVVAGAMLASQKIAIRQSGLLFEQDQSLHDIKAGQQLALALIMTDSQLNMTDSRQDIWAQPLSTYSLADHDIDIDIMDDASRFNINNLYHDGQVDLAALAAFERLLAQVGIKQSVATAVLDWQDPDDQVYNDSAKEAALYQSTAFSAGNGQNSQQLPNQPFFSVDQLTKVAGINAQTLAKLRPYITAVPYYLPVNVNTASAEVMAAVIEGVSTEQLQPVIADRESQVIERVEALWQSPAIKAVSQEAKKSATPLLAVNSRAFTAIITSSESKAKSSDQALRQRFATVKISKIATDASADGSSDAAAPLNGDTNKTAHSSEVDDKAQANQVIQAFGQRLWPYRPTILSLADDPS